jgi:rhodanese-related sulfurtransferase
MRILQTNRSAVKQAIWHIPAIIVVAGLIAVGINHFRADGLPLVGNWSVEARFADAAGESLVVSLEEARRLFAVQGTLFLDARPAEQYAENHIQGALSLPWQEVDQSFDQMSGCLEQAAAIITYCDGESCDLSHELALFLKEMGFKNVRVLVNGWTLWQQAGLPIRMGADGTGKEAHLKNVGAQAEPPQDQNSAVVVYYFHRTIRCPSCTLLEEITRGAVEFGFEKELNDGKIRMTAINLDEKANQHFVDDYGLTAQSVVVSEVDNGKEQRWKNLDQVWTLLEDEGQLWGYIQKEIKGYLQE